MRNTYAIFYASLLTGMLSLADLRMAANHTVHILTGVEVTAQDTVKTKKTKMGIYTTAKKGQDGEQHYINTDDNRSEEVVFKGKATLTSDLKDISSISPNGHLKYKRTENDFTRRIEIVSDAAGNLTRTYSENGKKLAYEPAGKAWLQEVMPDLIAATGIGLEELVKTVYQKDGAKGVLAEAGKSSSNYGKVRFVNHLLAQPNLKTNDVREVLQFTEKHINSDYELRKVLEKLSASHLSNQGIVQSYLQVSGKISSDYERGKALTHLLKAPNLSNENIALALEKTGSISSDYEKSKVLQQFAKLPAAMQHNYKPAFAAINKISSDYEKAKTINAFLEANKMSQAQYKELLPVVSRISSDYEKGKVLRNMVSKMPSDDAALKEEMRKAANTISSDYEKNKVLSSIK